MNAHVFFASIPWLPRVRTYCAESSEEPADVPDFNIERLPATIAPITWPVGSFDTIGRVTSTTTQGGGPWAGLAVRFNLTLQGRVAVAPNPAPVTETTTTRVSTTSATSTVTTVTVTTVSTTPLAPVVSDSLGHAFTGVGDRFTLYAITHEGQVCSEWSNPALTL